MNYDFSNWHPECSNKSIIQAPDGLHVVCLGCGVSANLEAISAKISPEDACKVGKTIRIAIGKQSFNVDRGGISK